jgi:hypothetical protein
MQCNISGVSARILPLQAGLVLPTQSFPHAEIHVQFHISACYCCQILIRTGLCQQILVQLSKFHENLSLVLKLLHTDRWTDITKLTGAFLQLLLLG